MRRSPPATASSTVYADLEDGEGFRFLAFNPLTGEVLAHGPKAALALAQADLREPHKAILILDAGPAGRNLWKNRTRLPMAQAVIEMLAESWNDQPRFIGNKPEPRLH